ncbi:hypothetical protein CDL15_Pgr013363 [Punica granatum]|nr:hypothetical protein CDL15_Pgr013363 [Punica granatum]
MPVLLEPPSTPKLKLLLATVLLGSSTSLLCRCPTIAQLLPVDVLSSFSAMVSSGDLPRLVRNLKVHMFPSNFSSEEAC